MLLQRIGGIFDQDLSNRLRRFLVEDRGTERDELRVVLLAESPHNEEVESPEIYNRYPLAGSEAQSTGLRIRNKLMEWIPRLNLPEQQPIGQLVHESHDTVQQLGIMNVSQLPFQEGPYGQDDGVRQNQYWDDYIECMKYIKDNPGVKTYSSDNRHPERTQRWRQLRCTIVGLEHAIIKDLAGRLAIIGGDVQVMCLGEVAQIFYLKSLYYLDTNKYILDFPHPSYGNWDNLSPEIDPRLREILGSIPPSQAT